MANGGVEHTGSFFVRVYETVSLHLHERAANSFLRAQAVFDTVTAGKMAAAAASAAAVAGGGFAVEGVVAPAAPDRPAAILRGAVGGRGCPALKTMSRAHARARAKPRSHAAQQAADQAHAQPAARERRGVASGAAKPAATTRRHRDDHDQQPAARRRPRPRAVGRLGRRGSLRQLRGRRVRLRGSVT